MFGVVNPTEEKSRETYGTLVSALDDKKAKEPRKAGPFGGALIDNPSLSSSNGTTTETGSPSSTAAPSGTQTTIGQATSFTFITINPQPTDASTNPSAVDNPAAVDPSATAGPVQAAAGMVRSPAALLLGVVGFAMLMI